MNTLVCTILNIFKPLKKNKVLQQSKYVPKDIIINKKYDLDIKITYSKAWRAKELAVKLNNGSYEESYTILPKYCEDIKNTSPGSMAFVDITEDNKFKHMFICFDAAASRFTFCHPILGLDGTHLKSKYLGILFTATSIDATSALFPVVYAVVDVENDDNWLWFLNTLRPITDQHAPSFI